MNNLSLWVANQKRFEFVVDTIEGVTLNLIALTDDLIQTVKMNDNSNDMMLACADYGVSNGDIRFCEDDKLAEYLGNAWVNPEFMIECDPSLKFQVGERVAEMSGIIELIVELRDAEEFAELEAKEAEKLAQAEKEVADMEADSKPDSNIVDGDDLGDTSVSLEELYEDKAAAQVA